MIHQETIYRVSIRPIYFYLLKQSKFSLILISSKMIYLLIGAALLLSKLIARKSQNLQSFSFQLFVHFRKTCVIFVSQSSLRGYVYYQYCFFISIDGESDVVAIYVVGFEVEERGWVVFVIVLLIFFV